MNEWTSNRINDLLNELLGNKEKKNYWVAGDTDSCYLCLEDVVEFLGMRDKSEDEIVETLDKFINEILEPAIKDFTNELCDYLNNVENKMVWEREVISPSAIFVAKKRYAMLVKDSEGVKYKTPNLKIIGLESKKSSTPEWAKKHLEECYRLCLLDDKTEYMSYVNGVKSHLRKLRPDEIAMPTKINGVEKYQTKDYEYVKGTPKHVKAAIIHNRLLKKLDLKHYKEICSGESLKYLSLKKPNPINEEVIGFSSASLPPEFGLESYIDYDEAYVRGFEKPLKNFVSAIKWDVEEIVGLF